MKKPTEKNPFSQEKSTAPLAFKRAPIHITYFKNLFKIIFLT